MTSSNEFPSNLSTNTYLLHDFTEIACIVCTGAIPPGPNVNVKDANSSERILERLRNAEQQFRQASILVVLDTKNLELFTFYKKVDIVKDQKTILTRFSNICKTNHCIIAYKNACRSIDLVTKPEMRRVHTLFTEAVLSSLHLHVANASKTVVIGPNIYLTPSYLPYLEDRFALEEPRTRWHLRKIDLQIIQSGQLLMAVRSANWPPLAAFRDVVEVRTNCANELASSTLYLAPTGQLARVTGKWVGHLITEGPDLQAGEIAANKVRTRWAKKTIAWLDDRNKAHGVDEKSTWVEIEIPVLAPSHDSDGINRDLQWKTMIWPIDLTYMLLNSNTSTSGQNSKVLPEDPLKWASEWFLKGAAEAREIHKNNKSNNILEPTHDDDHLFDDEAIFGSPRQFMSHPMQTFANQSHMVYPTPPEGPATQPTPGFSIDGTAQTPMTGPTTHPNVYQSSPLATMTDSGPPMAQDSAINNFLRHNAEDDLFDDIEDTKMEHDDLAGEPNWDFFEPEVMNTAPEQKQENFEDGSVAIGSPRAESVSEEMEKLGYVQQPAEQQEITPDVSPLQGEAQAPADSTEEQYLTQPTVPHTKHESPLEPVTSPETQNAFGREVPVRRTKRPKTPPITSLKRRRSSAYDVSPQILTSRDHKYSIQGKYWFEPKRQPAFSKSHPAPTPYYRSASSSSTSSGSSSFSSEIDGSDGDTEQIRPWAQYVPAPVNNEPHPHDSETRDEEIDADVASLLEVISTASGIEPFATPLPPHCSPMRKQMDQPRRHSMTHQLLTEQLALSSLLSNNKYLKLPDPSTAPAAEVLVDHAGSTTALTSTLLGELTCLQPFVSPSRLGSRVTSLENGSVRLRQADSEIIGSLPMTRFWETLNLQPLNGSKDVLALCLFPQSENYAQACSTFLQRMSETYSLCNLGTHKTALLEGLAVDGLLALETDVDISQTFHDIGNALADVEIPEDCMIFYVVIPDDDLSRCWELCDAFVELFETLEPYKDTGICDIALQLIPSSFIVDSDTLTIRPEEQYINLALEVYHRLPPVPDDSELLLCAPALTVENPPNHNLQFELNTKAISPLSKHGQPCHIAYCFSMDKRWLMAAWTDATGTMEWKMSYCLVDNDGNEQRSRLEVFRHICETSVQLFSRQKDRWWLALAKVGIFEDDEREDWLFLAGQLGEEQRMLTRVVLLSVELQPRLSLYGSSFSAKQLPPQNSLNTPVSTPQATTTSPEQGGIPVTPTAASVFATNAQTPPDLNAETGDIGEIILADPLEDSWMATFSFGLNQSHDFLVVRPALASGLLMKRTASQGNVGTGMATLGVNMVAVPRQPNSPLPFSEREAILQEIIIQYRGLHTLAVARRCIDPRGNCVPQHVAIAYKGARVLEQFA